MQVVVVGAGALGSTLAIAFARAGDDVTLLVRHHEVADSSRRHIYLTLPERDPLWAIIPTVTELSETPDVIIIATQTHDIAEACTLLVHHLQTVQVLMTTQLSTHGDTVIQQQVGVTTSIIQLVPDFTAAIDATGQVTIAGPLHATIGQMKGPVGTALLQQLATTINMTIATECVANIDAHRRTRFFFSLPETLTATADLPLATSVQEKALLHANLAILREAAKVLVAQSLPLAPLPPADVERWLKVPSMLGLFADRFIHQQESIFTRFGQLPSPSQQHLRRHHSTEVADLNGEIVRLGHEKGIPTPVNDRIIAVVQGVERTGTFLSRDALLKIASKL